MTKLEDLTPLSYLLDIFGRDRVTLDYQPGQLGRRGWIIHYLGDCLNTNLEWEYEPVPSNRDEAFRTRCRFDPVEQALAVWDRYQEKMRAGAP